MTKVLLSTVARQGYVMKVCSTRQSRAPKLAANGTPDFAELATSYAIGLANNHAFVDGNKRAALLVTGLFLYLNGYKLTVSQADATMTVFSVAAGEMNEAGFAGWLRRHCVKR